MGVAVDDENVYWNTIDAATAIRRVSKDGGVVSNVTAVPTPMTNGAIATDGINVYWIGSGALQSVPVGGGSPTALAPTNIGGTIAAADGDVYWTELLINLDDTKGSLRRVPAAGGPVTVVMSPLCRPMGLAIDAAAIFVSDLCAGIWRIPRGAGQPTLVPTGGPISAGYVAVDDANLYFEGGSGTTILAWPLQQTGLPTEVFSLGGSMGGMAALGKSVFWSLQDGTSGSVYGLSE
jgi:hypothetical protein